MENSHLRLGRLNYQRNTTKTNTHVSVHVSHYIGEKDQAHLLSFFGHDAEVAAITASIQENHHFELHFPDASVQRIHFGPDASCYKGSLNLRERQKSLRHVVAVSSVLHANGSAGQTYVMHDEPGSEDLVWATVVSILGVPAVPDWGGHILQELRADKKIIPITGIGCEPSVIRVTREELLERLAEACSSGNARFPDTNGAVLWREYELSDMLAVHPIGQRSVTG